MSGIVTHASLLAAASALSAVAAAATTERPSLPSLPVSAGDTMRGRPRLPAWLATGASRRATRRLAGLLEEARIGWSPQDVVASRRIAIAVLAASAAVLPGVGLALVPVAVIATRAPDIVLARLAARRTREASRELPVFLDLLAVATGAGLAPQLAVRRALEPVSGPLAEELERALHDAELGSRWRDELSAAAERTRLPELRRAVGMLIRTERLGSSLADEMARLASDVRESRRSRAAERARTAPVKMLFPLVFLILPAFLLLTVVPVLLATVRSIG